MKKFQKKKLRDELVFLVVTNIGLILILRHFLDLCPWIAWIGAAIFIIGATGFIEVRDKDYRKKYSQRG